MHETSNLEFLIFRAYSHRASVSASALTLRMDIMDSRVCYSEIMTLAKMIKNGFRNYSQTITLTLTQSLCGNRP